MIETAQFEYLAILVFLLCVALFLEKNFHLHLYKNRKERLEITFLFFVIGVVWDHFAIWRGHWFFPEGSNLGIKIGLMPIEEYVFILVIPYFVVTVYKLFDSKFRKNNV